MTALRVMPSRMPASVGGVLQHAALDEEDVVAGAFGDLALVVEHQGFEAAGLDGLDLGQDVVEVVQRLDARIEGVGMVADRADRDDLQAVLVQFRRIEGDVVDDDDDLRIGRLARVEAEVAGAARDDQADVAVLLVVGLDGALDARPPSARGSAGFPA